MPLPPHARARSHRVVAAATFVALLVVLLTFVPLARGAGVPLTGWFAQSKADVFPTPTPSPTPVYAVHPVASGVGGFICVALPFARLAQVIQLRNGQPRPWYVSLILAQWGFEQGWNIPGYTGYNWGNSSAIAGYPAVSGTNQPGSPGAFAYAYDPIQGVGIYTTFTQMRFYTGVSAVWNQGPIAQAVALGQSPWDAGHYDEAGGPPGRTLVNIINEFGLQRFDNPNQSC